MVNGYFKGDKNGYRKEAERAGLVEYRVMFASLGAVCSVLVDLLTVAANWIVDPCK